MGALAIRNREAKILGRSHVFPKKTRGRIGMCGRKDQEKKKNGKWPLGGGKEKREIKEDRGYGEKK